MICPICEAKLQAFRNTYNEEFEIYADTENERHLKLQGGTLDVGIWCHHNNDPSELEDEEL